ncbi:S8/S53 family peptidase, partial [Candidatus Saccharibacteria bacterium]|nr:S8/S53 family peptidase [Candidatus Saccharibacteria bacterium]
MKDRRIWVCLGAVFVVLVGVIVGVGLASRGGVFPGKDKREVVQSEEPEGETRQMILGLKNAVANDEESIRAEVERLGDEFRFLGGYKRIVMTYRSLPMVVVEVDDSGLNWIEDSGLVTSVVEDLMFEVAREDDVVRDAQISEVPFDAPMANLMDYYSPLATIGGDFYDGFSDGSNTYNGAGYLVAVLDTGVNKTHVLLNGKVSYEACFSTAHVDATYVYTSLCPGGVSSAVGPGTGAECPAEFPSCEHGTAVAGAVAMNEGSYVLTASDGTLGINVKGVAVGADIMAVQVFSGRIEIAGGAAMSVVSFTSAQLAALDYINVTNFSKPVAAVNMSLGSAINYSGDYCTNVNAWNELFQTAALALHGNGIAVVIANGNSGANSSFFGLVGSPACIEGMIATGATNNAGTGMAPYSQNGVATTLLAPGGVAAFGSTAAALAQRMWLPIPNNTLSGMQGTSMAAPMVAGAYAVLRQKFPHDSVLDLTNKLVETGILLTDTRAGYGAVPARPLIQVDEALRQADIHSSTGNEATLNLNFEVPSTIALILDDEEFDMTIDSGQQDSVITNINVFTFLEGWQLTLEMAGGSVNNSLSGSNGTIPMVDVSTGLGGTSLLGSAWGFRYGSGSSTGYPLGIADRWRAIPVNGAPTMLEDNGTQENGWFVNPFEV